MLALCMALTLCFAEQTEIEAANAAEPTVIGEGETVFSFVCRDLDGTETVFEVHTNQTVVGEALQELGLIDGEEGPYGLYVLTVNGILQEYDTTGHYWAFYINDDYAMTGVDVTEIAPDTAYAFRAE